MRVQYPTSRESNKTRDQRILTLDAKRENKFLRLIYFDYPPTLIEKQKKKKKNSSIGLELKIEIKIEFIYIRLFG